MSAAFLVIAGLLFALPAPEDARTLADQLLINGAALFDKHDAAAMAETYVENGEVQLLIRESNSDSYRRDTRSGREQVREGYADLFRDMDPSARSRNTVESARFVGASMLVIEGRFQPDMGKTDSIDFVQVRVRDGGAWKILSIQLLFDPAN